MKKAAAFISVWSLLFAIHVTAMATISFSQGFENGAPGSLPVVTQLSIEPLTGGDDCMERCIAERQIVPYPGKMPFIETCWDLPPCAAARAANGATGSISGSVSSPSDGIGLQNVGVTVLNASWSYVNSSVTDINGNYTVGGLATGSYYVKTSNNTYIDEYYDNIRVIGIPYTSPPVGATSVSVTDGVNTPNINFVLDLGGSIAGQVTRNRFGTGIQGVNIYVYSTSWAVIKSSGTDINGNYTVGGLPTGNYYLKTLNNTYVDEYYGNIPVIGNPLTFPPVGATSVSVTEGLGTPNINFVLDLGGSISGRVTRDPEGTGIQNVTIYVYDTSWNYLKGRATNTTGTYTVGGLPTGNYHVYTYNSLGYVDEYYNNVPVIGSHMPPLGVTPVEVIQTLDTPNINFLLDLGGSISGRVTRDPEGTGIQNVEIDVFDTSWNFLKSASTDVNGYYTVAGLLEGSYFVRTLNIQGYADEYYNNLSAIRNPWPHSGANSVNVVHGAATPNINFGLPAQYIPYVSYSINPNTPYSYIPGSNMLTSWNGNRLDGYFDLALGDFDFRFYGMPVINARISTHGYITFGTAGMTFVNAPIPNVNLPNAFVAPFWDDLDLTGLTGERGVWWGFNGTPPSRQLVIEWYQVPHSLKGTETYWFELILYESTNKIKFQYVDVDSGTLYDFGASATIGLENPDGTRGVQYSYNGSRRLSNNLAIEFIPTPVNLCDFNGDGKTDIVWRNKTTGQNAVWFMNGTTWVSTSWLIEVTDTSWEIVGMGDFNNDGKTDIVWRYKTNGQDAVWLMDGTSVSSVVSLPQVSDTGWEIVGPK